MLVEWPSPLGFCCLHQTGGERPPHPSQRIQNVAQSANRPLLACGSTPGRLQAVIFLVCSCMFDMMALFKKHNDGILRYGKGGAGTYLCQPSVNFPSRKCQSEEYGLCSLDPELSGDWDFGLVFAVSVYLSSRTVLKTERYGLEGWHL